MKYTDIEGIAKYQREQISRQLGMLREEIDEAEVHIEGFATIITGIRRCGKSTLMGQMMARTEGTSVYLNFDNPRFADFSTSDFALIDKLVSDTNADNLFFDEIQLIPNWESYVRSTLDNGKRVVVTGSNASMLSRELGTRLTGRHLSKAMYPFSYTEFCKFREYEPSPESMSEYLTTGGFPQYVKYMNGDILISLLDDIIYRDIAVRYGVRDVQSLRELACYLVTNVGNLVSANKLTQAVHAKTAKTILEYFSYFTQAYLFFFVPRYAYSYKAQMLHPRKVYCIDNGLCTAVTMSATDDDGHKLENAVYVELLRRGGQVYYYSDGGKECDFLICKNNKPIAAYQVCLNLNHDNEEREVSGLINAMSNLKIDKGVIISLDQEDTIAINGLLINVIPAWKWMTSFANIN